jgi:ornithine carbamoyltransferase
VRHLISIDDLTDEDLRSIVTRANQLRIAGRRPERTLDGCVLGTYFKRTSTRTRTGFTAAALRLGAEVIAFGPADLQLNTGESIEDTGRVLSGMLDVLVARTADSEADLRAMATQRRMSIVNAMTAEEHPTQALADLTTLLGRFGRIDGLRVLYVGEGNNTAAALALALARLDNAYLELRTPPGYGLADDLSSRARLRAAAGSARLVERHDLGDLPTGCDVVYTTRWQTTGTSKATDDWRERFAPFQVNGEMMRANPKAVFMHDLPAHRGEEVTAEVLDGPASVAFDQAENKMYSAMAILEWCWR